GCDPLPTSVHHLLDDGQVAVVVADDSLPVALAWQAGNAGIPAMLELTDHSPIALPNPVRSLIWLSGTLRPVDHPRRLAAEIAEILPHPELLDVGHRSELLCLTLDSVVAADTTGAEAVDVTDILDAAPDPFAALETEWLQHLEEDHADIVRQIARRIPPAHRSGRIRPLGLDRYGLRLRVESEGDDHDVGLPCHDPVEAPAARGRALRRLVGCPCRSGLPPRT